MGERAETGVCVAVGGTDVMVEVRVGVSVEVGISVGVEVGVAVGVELGVSEGVGVTSSQVKVYDSPVASASL